MSLMAVGPDNDPFAQDFLRDLVPFVQKTYPVSTRREDTAIAGFSMGGVQTLNLAIWHPEVFGYVSPIEHGLLSRRHQANRREIQLSYEERGRPSLQADDRGTRKRRQSNPRQHPGT